MSNPPSQRRSGETFVALGWATGTPRLGDSLRRGAWYPIKEYGEAGLVLIEVDHVIVAYSRDDLRIRLDRPEQWSVVSRTGVMRPTLAGPKLVTTYAVCPDCTGRQEFEGQPETLMCVRCRRAATVDWSTTY